MISYSNPTYLGINKETLDSFTGKIKDGKNRIHSLVMLRGNHIFYEATSSYHKVNELHRMYSSTKSLTGLAMGLLIDDKLIKLNDPISSFFPEYINEFTDKVLLTQTIEDTLKMATCVVCDDWFRSIEDDRVKLYFSMKHSKEPGKVFEYDSAGTQILCAIVEKVTGMNMYDFLYKRVLSKLDFFKKAYMLKTPMLRSWGDSGLIANVKGMLSLGRLYLNKGIYNNERIISEDWIIASSSKHIDTVSEYDCKNQGYGYQIWMIRNGYAFYGMGNQITLIFPKKDIVVSMTGCCFGELTNRELIINEIYKVVESAKKYSSVKISKPYKAKLDTFTLKGSSNIKSIVNRKYFLEEFSPIKSFKIKKSLGSYSFRYYKDGKYRNLKFRLNGVIRTIIPEDGYSNLIGKLKSNKHYKALGTGGVTDNKLMLSFEIIDIYLGLLSIEIDLSNEMPSITLKKNAENYLNEFTGNYKIIKEKQA